MKNILNSMQWVIWRTIDSFTVMILRKIADGEVV